MNNPPADESPLARTVRAELAGILASPDPEVRLRAAHELARLLDELGDEVRAVRLEALKQLRDQRMSYDDIARASGMSRARVAQLARGADKGSRRA